jgi:hypothetical protein
VDLLVEANGKTLAIEIKSGVTVASDWFKHLDTISKISEAAVDARMVVYGGNEEQHRSKGHVCPWWIFLLRICAWLQDHNALPNEVDFLILNDHLMQFRN